MKAKTLAKVQHSQVCHTFKLFKCPWDGSIQFIAMYIAGTRSTVLITISNKYICRCINSETKKQDLQVIEILTGA